MEQTRARRSPQIALATAASRGAGRRAGSSGTAPTGRAGKRDAPRSAGGVVSLSTACRPRSVASASSVQHPGPSNGAGAIPVENRVERRPGRSLTRRRRRSGSPDNGGVENTREHDPAHKHLLGAFYTHQKPVRCETGRLSGAGCRPRTAMPIGDWDQTASLTLGIVLAVQDSG